MPLLSSAPYLPRPVRIARTGPRPGPSHAGTPTISFAARVALALACLTAAGSVRALDGETLRIGIGSRIAAAPLHVAASRGYFEREELDVELVQSADADLVEALAEEELHLATASANALLDADDGGIELRGAYVLGISGAADALVSRDEVGDTRELVGRRVAVLPGSAGELLLRQALQRKGRRLRDLEPIALADAQAVRALLDGEVDAATLHGPVLAALRRTDRAARGVADADTGPAAGIDPDTDPDAVATPLRVLETAENPRGLVSDLLVGTEDVLDENKETVKGVIRALDRAIGWMRRNPEESVALLADAYTAEAADVASALGGTELFDVEENMTLLRGQFQKAFSAMSEVIAVVDDDDRAREVPSANRYLDLSALRQVAVGR